MISYSLWPAASDLQCVAGALVLVQQLEEDSRGLSLVMLYICILGHHFPFFPFFFFVIFLFQYMCQSAWTLPDLVIVELLTENCYMATQNALIVKVPLR